MLIPIIFLNNLTAQINNPNIPQLETYNPLTPNNNYCPNIQQLQKMGYNPPITPPTDLDLQHQFILNQYQQTQSNSYRQHQELLQILKEINTDNKINRIDPSYNKSNAFTNDSKNFINAFNTLNDMLTGKKTLSVSKAYFTIESAYGNTYLSEKEYNNTLAQSAKFIKEWLKQNGYNPLKNEDLQYGLQKFMRDTLTVTIKQLDKNKSTTTTHLPFSYDYEDFKGEQDYRNYFITKCLATGTGQCNSFPGVYLSISEKIGATTYLTFAPQHSFVKYPDSKGMLHGYEPTSNWKISDKWYIEHMGITAKAVKSGIYLNALNNKQIVASCMLDLATGYMNKYGATDGKFITDCINTSMQYYPRKNNIYAYFIKSCLLARQISKLLYANKIKDIKDIGKLPVAKGLYLELLKNEEIIKELGYQDMPESVYLELMKESEFKGRMQQNKYRNTKQKRNLFSTNMNY